MVEVRALNCVADVFSSRWGGERDALGFAVCCWMMQKAVSGVREEDGWISVQREAGGKGVVDKGRTDFFGLG